jgi:hypothetical protein
MNIILEAGLAGEVRMAGRAAPWDGLLARALADAKLGYRAKGTVVLIGRPERLARLSLPDLSNPAGNPVTLSIRAGSIQDFALLFADISSRKVKLPEASCDPVTVYFREVPWDEAFSWIVASCGWTSHIDADAIRVEVPGGGR